MEDAEGHEEHLNTFLSAEDAEGHEEHLKTFLSAEDAEGHEEHLNTFLSAEDAEGHGEHLCHRRLWSSITRIRRETVRFCAQASCFGHIVSRLLQMATEPGKNQWIGDSG